IHWILNLAQFQSQLDFGAAFAEIIGQNDTSLIGRILVSDEDRNWDSIRELWRLKEKVKGSASLKAAFKPDTSPGVLRDLGATEEGRAFMRDIDAYKMEFGNKAIYTHEYIFVTWRENPAPIIEALRGYLDSDYDYAAAVEALRKGRNAAIAEMWSRFPANRAEADRVKLQKALDLALKMAPLTPDHHFYMDQGTYARVRLVFMAIGGRLVETAFFRQPDDWFYLKYEELRIIAADSTAFDSRKLIADRRKRREDAFKVRPRAWYGTITDWSLNGEPYKGNWGWPDI